MHVAPGPRHPYSTYFNSTPEITRNAATWFTYNPASPNQLTFESRCVLMMSPFLWSKSENNQCLFGVQSIKVSLQFWANLQRMLGGLNTTLGFKYRHCCIWYSS